MGDVEALMTAPADLSPIERAHWRAQAARAPVGHLVTGPHARPPFWRCITCGVQWSDGTHPMIIELPEPERALPYPLEA